MFLCGGGTARGRTSAFVSRFDRFVQSLLNVSFKKRVFAGFHDRARRHTDLCFSSFDQQVTAYRLQGPQAGTVFSIYGSRKAEGIRLKEKTKKKIKLAEPT